MADWQDNLVESRDGMAAILKDTRRIAVLGIKTEAQSDQPAFYVPAYMAEAGYEIVPVPVYYPDVTEILGEPVYRTLAEIPEPVDMVNVFRRSRAPASRSSRIADSWSTTASSAGDREARGGASARQQRDELPREPGTCRLVLVLEEDEGIAPRL